MKPATRRRLKLDTEILKTLSRAELAEVVGGVAPAVNAVTQQLSWCDCVPPA